MSQSGGEDVWEQVEEGLGWIRGGGAPLTPSTRCAVLCGAVLSIVGAHDLGQCTGTYQRLVVLHSGPALYRRTVPLRPAHTVLPACLQVCAR